MKRTSRLAALSLAALLCPVSSAAQTSAPPAGKLPAKARRVAADPLAETRRANAVALVTSLADEARGYKDETLRARVQSRAANALWEMDAEKSRALFRRAWDAADSADRESQRRTEEERQRQRQAGGPMVWRSGPDLRGEVLRLAARRDRALGEEFLARLDDARKQQERDALTPAKTEAPKATELMGDDPAQGQRLSLARQLLEAGDAARARQFAEPALQSVTDGSLRFLVALRQTAPADADKLYAAMLARAAADPGSDANTVSRLMSYVFTPQLFINIDRGGGYGISNTGEHKAPDGMPDALRRAFLQTAAAVLVRPLPPPDQDRSTSGRLGAYFMIARLLPLFEQHLSAAVPPLRAQLAALSPDATQTFRSQIENLLTSGLVPEEQRQRDDVQNALDKLSRASTPNERDGFLMDAAFAAAAKGDPRAREFAERVSDPDARAQLLTYIDYDAVSRALAKKDAEEAVRLARKGELTSLQRVWALTEAAKLFAKDDRGRSLELLDEAAAESRRIDEADSDRARATLAVITPLFELDQSRVWSLMPELVKTINALPGYTGEGGHINVTFRTRSRASMRSGNVETFNLQPIFESLAREDMNRAVEFARTLSGDAPRAVATLAIASAVLNDGAKPKPRT